MNFEFCRQWGLTGFSFGFEGGGKSLIKVAEIFVDTAQVHLGMGLSDGALGLR